MIAVAPWSSVTASVPLAPTVFLKVDTRHPGYMFKLGAVELSLEAAELSTDHLAASHHRLVRLMRLLGPSVLRLGGDSVDSSWWTSSGEPAPAWATNTVTPAALSALRELLTATGWRVLLGVDLGHFEPARAADEARYANEILGADLLGIEIGNEPDNYAARGLRPSIYGPGEYLREATAYRQAVNAAAPGVAVDGPTLSATPWLVQLATAASAYVELTQHYYPASVCTNASPLSAAVLQATASGLLSPAVREEEDHFLAVLARVRAIAGRPTRIGETNDVACGGSASASPVFASALWSLDWTLRGANSGVIGLNFHGSLGFCGDHSYSPICAESERAASAGDVTAQPEYYGLLAARQLEGGRFLPTRGIGAGVRNLTTWGTLARNGTIRVVIDDLATIGPNQPVSVSVAGYTVNTKETLSAGSPSARDRVRLGTAVTDGGIWKPLPRALSRLPRSPIVILRPASAIVITLHPKSLH